MPTKSNADMLNTIQDQMRNRLKELEPLVDEYNRISDALNRMNPPKRGRPKGSKNKPKNDSAPADA